MGKGAGASHDAKPEQRYPARPFPYEERRNKDTGVNKMTMYATMRSGGSVADSILIDTIDIAIKIDDAISSR
mgnify:CR=1 FL=1